MRRDRLLAFLTLLSIQTAFAQVLVPRSEAPAQPTPAAAPTPTFAPTMSLVVPAGTPLKVALDRQIRVRDAGEPIHAKVVEPVYAFDKLVVPAGSSVDG